MTLRPDAHPPAPCLGPPRLVSVAIGPAAEVVALQQQAAPRLAGLTGLELRSITPAHDPDRALTALHATEPDPLPTAATTGWLAALPLDVGLTLAGGGSWALALAAWRQPTLLLIDGRQPASGLAAAATALLRQCGVPLLGLVQWGGAWDAPARRLDGLPWLGWLGETAAPDDSHEEATAAVLPALRQRWQQLQQS